MRRKVCTAGGRGEMGGKTALQHLWFTASKNQSGGSNQCAPIPSSVDLLPIRCTCLFCNFPPLNALRAHGMEQLKLRLCRSGSTARSWGLFWHEIKLGFLPASHHTWGFQFSPRQNLSELPRRALCDSGLVFYLNCWWFHSGVELRWIVKDLLSSKHRAQDNT